VFELGKKNKVEAVVAEDIYLTVPKRKKKTIKAVVEYYGPIEAPIAKGDKLGLLNIYIAGELEKEIDILSGEEIRKANIFSRLFKSFNFLVWGDV
jgi:D-alanyl-D-alanine carboxypeptidase (penicillin-binding protein 5/6)